MIRLVLKFFVLLNSASNPWQLAFGAAFGMVLGLTPLLSLHNVFVLLLLLVLRVNISFALLSMAVCAGFAYVFDAQFHQLGWQVLNATSLRDIWTMFYNHPVLRWSNFNNTVLMGSLIVSLLAFFPFAVLMRVLITVYRSKAQPHIEKLKVVQLLKASRWYDMFSKLDA